MAAASSAISFLMSSAVPSTWYFHRTARAEKLKFPSSEGARTPGPVYRIAFCPRYHRGFRPSPTLTESTDSFLAGCAVCCLRMWDRDHIWGRRLPPGRQQPAAARPLVLGAAAQAAGCRLRAAGAAAWCCAAYAHASRGPSRPAVHVVNCRGIERDLDGGHGLAFGAQSWSHQARPEGER